MYREKNVPLLHFKKGEIKFPKSREYVFELKSNDAKKGLVYDWNDLAEIW